ncbi:MAG: methyl-accepting chemotaxis protein [Paraglaciecola sp.]|uniref:methyl-accepting chemotaxis protein n=1 Tax=Paraglaciecola sp. TaxID=1920173 RepID=UPI00329A02BB
MLLNKLSIRNRLLTTSILPLVITCIALLSIIYVQLGNLIETEKTSATQLITKTKKTELKNIIDLAYHSIKPLYEGGGSREEAVQIMQRMEFGEDGYIFGYDGDSTRIFSGTSSAGIGNSYRDFKDVNGVFLINDLVTAGRKNKLGDGNEFVTYHFAKPNETVASPKLSYSIFLEKWDLMIGVGIYVDSIEKDSAIFEVHVEEVSNTLLTSVTVISIILIILMVAVSLFIVSSILTPLNTVSESIRQLSAGNGDLTQRIPVQDKFETGILAENLNSFLISLQDDIKHIYNVALDVDSETNLLVEQTDNIKLLSSQQQTSVESVASATTEMNASSNEVLINAKTASDAANAANSHGKEALDQIEKSSSEMGELIIEIKKAHGIVEDVGGDVENIGTILQVIESIAEQTNLLALNAAIEAARAGEQGRGFAVVADEVRNLASKTQGSTEQIQQMIAKLQSNSKLAVEGMQRSMTCSSAAEQSVSQTSTTLSDIVGSIRKITNMNSEIANAAEEQNQVGNDIGKQIVEIFTQTSGLNDIIEQNNKTSDNLREKANELDNIVNQFKL